MPQQTPPRASNPAVMMIIHFAFIGAVFVYAALVMLGVVGKNENAESIEIMKFILPVLGLMNIPLGFIFPKIARMHPSPDLAPELYLGKAQLSIIISGAFFEMIAIYGLVGVIIGGLPHWIAYSMMGLSLLLLLSRIGSVRDHIDTFHRLKREAERG